MKVLRYGHLRSAPVVVDATYTHGVGTAYTPCSVVGLHALRRLLHEFPPLLRRANASKEESRRFVDGVADKVTDSMLSSWQSRTSRSFSVLRQAFTTDPEVHERIRGSSGWQMTYSFCPLRAVGVTALPRQGGQVPCRSRQQSSPFCVAD